MKKLFLYIISFALLLIIGCSDDSGSGSPTDPFGGGGGNGGTGGNVSFTISTTQGTQGGIIFNATPSANVKITKVTVSLPAQTFTDEITGDGTTVYNANTAVELAEYTGVASGQQWTFKFEGTTSDNNQTFDVTSNYTIP